MKCTGKNTPDEEGGRDGTECRRVLTSWDLLIRGLRTVPALLVSSLIPLTGARTRNIRELSIVGSIDETLCFIETGSTPF
uniref:Uncharacterized protein n=1 Tax=Timema tahoe TaxID=61484 RepID=A0A7R9INP1_9NEOP|nr:unnamed protein product [Timema tahoe]